MTASRRGFTLLEMMVALTIFVLLGAGAQALVHSILQARDTIHRRAYALARLQRTINILEQDITQMETQSLAIPPADGLATFIRHGWSNPLSLPRSDMQFVKYTLEGHELRRYYWPAEHVGDAALSQTLDDDVLDFTLSPIAPRAVQISLQTREFGQIRRFFLTSEP